MRILGILILSLLAAGAASAATIDLTDGRVVQGDIVSQNGQSVQINEDGVTMTYYADEIKDIDGKPFAVAAPAPAPAVTPDQSQAASAPAVAPSPASSPDTEISTETIDPVKKALILKFIDVFGTRAALNNNFELMLAQIAKSKPDEAKKIRSRVNIDELIDRLVPIYDQNFSSEDLQALIAFYSSPEGQKLMHTIPLLMKESVGESIKYMQEKFPEAQSGQ